VRDTVRARWARLTISVPELSGAEDERVDDFFRHGMALNGQAAMGVPGLSVSGDWVQTVAPGDTLPA
jgi:hypothetical protein